MVGALPGLHQGELDHLPDRAGDARLTDADGLDQLPDGERRSLQRRQDRHMRRLGLQTGIRRDSRRTGLQPFTQTLQTAAEEGRPEFLDDIHRHDIHQAPLFNYITSYILCRTAGGFNRHGGFGSYLDGGEGAIVNEKGARGPLFFGDWRGGTYFITNRLSF